MIEQDQEVKVEVKMHKVSTESQVGFIEYDDALYFMFKHFSGTTVVTTEIKLSKKSAKKLTELLIDHFGIQDLKEQFNKLVSELKPSKSREHEPKHA